MKKCPNYTFAYLPLFKRISGWTLSNPGAFTGFTSLSAVETSLGVKGQEYSASVASAFTVLSSRYSLIVCGLSFSALNVALRFEAMVLEFVFVLWNDIGVPTFSSIFFVSLHPDCEEVRPLFLDPHSHYFGTIQECILFDILPVYIFW